MKQITEDYVSYEIAKLLKEKGFDEPSRFWYNDKGIISQKYIDPTSNPLGKVYSYAAPTQSLALKWLREVHNIHITLHPSGGVWNGSYTWSVYYKRGKQSKDYQLTRQGHEKSYEEACEAALLYVLKNLI